MSIRTSYLKTNNALQKRALFVIRFLLQAKMGSDVLIPASVGGARKPDHHARLGMESQSGFLPAFAESDYLAGLHEFGLRESMVSRYGLGLRLSVDSKVECDASIIEFDQTGRELRAGLREFDIRYFAEEINFQPTMI